MDITIMPDEMKALENSYMSEFGVPGALLMEHAAQGVVAALHRRAPGGCALFLCGPGNNGGDGYAAARLWTQQGGQAAIAEITPSLKGDAALNRTLALQAEVPVYAASMLHDQLPPCDIIVDALFGTGLSKPVAGDAARLIHLANQSGNPIIAVDIPSGLDGAVGKVLGPCTCATETITFHRMKPGLLLKDGPRFAGDITVHPILIPQDYGSFGGMVCMKPSDLADHIRPRDPLGHKGTFGKAVIFAGSPGMAGAAAFASNACIQTGAGLTTVLCPESILSVVQALAPGAVCIPLKEDDKHEAAAAQQIRQAVQSATVVAIGCGCGKGRLLDKMLDTACSAACPVVLDADALNALAGQADRFKVHPCSFFTPHPGEAARLLGCSTGDVTDDPLAALHALHEATGGNVLLKGARTLMTDGEHVAINRFGTPAMAKGGSGDVLTGILTGLLAQHPHRDPLEALQLAALIHGMAGMRAAKMHGENCVTPLHLIECIRLDSLDF